MAGQRSQSGDPRDDASPVRPYCHSANAAGCPERRAVPKAASPSASPQGPSNATTASRAPRASVGAVRDGARGPQGVWPDGRLLSLEHLGDPSLDVEDWAVALWGTEYLPDYFNGPLRRIGQPSAFERFQSKARRLPRNTGPRMLQEWWEAGELTVDDLGRVILDVWQGADRPERRLGTGYWVRLFKTTGFVTDKLGAGRPTEARDPVPRRCPRLRPRDVLDAGPRAGSMVRGPHQGAVRPRRSCAPNRGSTASRPGAAH